ncbi:type II secretion system F family protein [Paenibacillus sp. N3/727]|uniref:type II secretion system F family protein n=1 Tax=Paenibacillus sp. N3/727 TaxID=2925845 RepID=UPI001F539112|nr:type II secretion system F family protein [Paenibacillus sp. N3/727]UNK17533.1 type II secretion system F family protein [Paenibacillus sp. N3/727]
MLGWLCGALLILLVGGWVVLNQMGGERYRRFSRLPMEGLRLTKLTPPLLFVLDKSKVNTRFPILFFRIQRSVQKIHGLRHSAEMSLLFMADSLAYSWLILIGGCLWSIGTGEPIGVLVGGFLSILMPVSMVKDLNKKVLLRDQDIVMELPELLNKMILLVGAGETVQKAIVHCVERKCDDQHPLYSELRKMVGDWEGGHSFQQAFEQFSKRCAVQEVSIFTTTVLLNFRRGGNDFVLALRDLSRVLWEKRKAIARTRGEQASSKLVFPMVVIFMVVIVLVGAPAFMMMNM